MVLLFQEKIVLFFPSDNVVHEVSDLASFVTGES
jgi:hypothetical protein